MLLVVDHLALKNTPKPLYYVLPYVESIGLTSTCTNRTGCNFQIEGFGSHRKAFIETSRNDNHSEHGMSLNKK